MWQRSSGFRISALASLTGIVLGLAGAEPDFASGISEAQALSVQRRSVNKTQHRPAAQLTLQMQAGETQGDQIVLNGKIWTAAWSQQPSSSGNNTVRIGVSDAGFAQVLGGELLNTLEPAQQPIQWFSEPLRLASWLTSTHRYLDISPLVQRENWQVTPQGNQLQIITPPARIVALRQGQQVWGDRIVLDLNRPAPWQIEEQDQTLLVTLAAQASPALMQQFQPRANQPSSESGNRSRPQIQVESAQKWITLRISRASATPYRAWTATNPNRLIIDFRPDAMVGRQIHWAPGLQWKQQILRLGNARFPVVWLEVDPQANLALKPIWSGDSTLIGTAPLKETAQRWQAIAAINGGFFNRNNQLPLGAIRQDNTWLSSPILNRGAIAWTATGESRFSRLSLRESLTTGTDRRWPIDFLNSGYVQRGLSRYTPAWGPTYTPLSDGEVLVTVRNDRVVARQLGGTAQQSPVPIPTEGYLLVLRANPLAAPLLAVGTQTAVERTTAPPDFERYPQILGAGPLLLQNKQVVLNAAAEHFNPTFADGQAIRSAIGKTATGRLLIVTAHDRVGGKGPSLLEMTQIMQQLGATDALNLDGGSSTTLYLGGRLLNRPEHTVARVHNGIGIFIQPDVHAATN